ncbi:DUF2786 domain-containing protein [Streptomyces sp. NPDC002536]
MAEHGADESAVTAFTEAREDWLRARASEIGETLADHSPRLHKLVPSDLGDRRLLDALVMVRAASDEARVRPVADTVAWLELLIPHGHRHDLSSAVQEIRSALALTDEPALRSWNAEAWQEILLALWWSDRCVMAGPRQADDELISRWGIRSPVATRVLAPEHEPERQYHWEFTSLVEHLAAEAAPFGLLARAVFAEGHVSEAIETSMAESEATLQGAGHLALLVEERVRAEELRDWAEKSDSGAYAPVGAFLAELSRATETYLSEVIQPVIAGLSRCEKELLSNAEQRERQSAEAYLEEFFSCIDDVPSATDGELDSRTEQEAVARSARGELTWHAMRGSVPVWYHIIGSLQERAAALAFSGAASSSVIRVHADVEAPRQFDLFSVDQLTGHGAFGEPEDWYPEPGIALQYSRHSVTDLCELLVLARLGHARLEFLTPDTRGGFAVLRSLRAEVRADDAEHWAMGALAGLRARVPDPEDLADLLADECETDEDDELDGTGAGPGGEQSPEPQETPAGRDAPEAPTTSTAANLPEHLLTRVKAILRKAEDPAATPYEAEAYLGKATALMAKYGIEQAMLQGDDPASEQPADRMVDVTAPWMRECQRLLAAIGVAMRCQAVYPGGKANRHRVHLFGFAPDLESVMILYASLRLQMLQGAERAGVQHRPTKENLRAYKRSWMLGFIRAVALRIEEAERQAREETETERNRQDAGLAIGESRSVALVLADRSAVVKDAVSSHYGKLGKKRRVTFKGSGYWRGHADGQQADIGGPTLEGNR